MELSVDWEQAACLNKGVENFYQENAGSADKTKALVFCNVCPIREGCLEDSIERRDWHGVWGGLTGAERKRLLRNRQREARKRKAHVAG